MRLIIALGLLAVADFVTAVGPCFCCDYSAGGTAGDSIFLDGVVNCEDMKGESTRRRGKEMRLILVVLGCKPSKCTREYIFCPKPNIVSCDLLLIVLTFNHLC